MFGVQGALTRQTDRMAVEQTDGDVVWDRDRVRKTQCGVCEQTDKKGLGYREWDRYRGA